MEDLLFWISFRANEATRWKELVTQELMNDDGKVPFVKIEGSIFSERSSVISYVTTGRNAKINPHTDLVMPLMVKIDNELLRTALDKALNRQQSIDLKALRRFVWQWSNRRLWPEVVLIREGENVLAELSAPKV